MSASAEQHHLSVTLGGAMEAITWLSLSVLLLLMFVLPQSFSQLKLPLLAALRKMRTSVHAEIYRALLCGFLAMLIAAASNPYLSSFDFVFAFSIIPLILNSRDLGERSDERVRESAV